MPDVGVRLFGRFAVMCDNQLCNGFESRKVQELLAYLLIHHDRAHPREVLATMLWPESPAAQARKSLRHTLWQLQVALDATSPTAHNLIQIESEWVEVAAISSVHVDALLLRDAYRCTQALPPSELKPCEMQQLHDATRLYRSDLLDGCYQEWCLLEREHFQTMYLTLLERLLQAAIAHESYADGIEYGAQILRLERSHERTYRSLMELHYAAGDRAAALRQYDRCVSALQEELGVAPSQKTQQLQQQIRAEHSPNNELEQTAPAPLAPLSTILGELHQIGAALLVAQKQVQQHIQLVENELNRRR